jgi:serine/threonine-protein kinase
MTPADAARSGCPGPELLAAFGSGRLSDPEAERIAEHLGSCRSCEEALAAMADASLAGRLRGAGPVADDPELRRLEEFACGLSPRPGDPTDSGQDTPYRTGRSGNGQPPRDVGTGTAGEPPAGEDPPGRTFGPYELLGEPVGGGMGVVWRARHRVLNVVRALKMPRAGSETNPEAVTRFCIEGEAAARLEHPHIVRVHEFGQHDGQLYYAMEFLEGGTLARRLRAGPLPARRAAALVAALARAAHHAHERGVVHRDLKPSNVLFAADDTPKVTDFGLAKMLDASSPAGTRPHAVLGTAEYMAPEQAAGGAREAHPAMDVWALGTVLYECLTGRPAFKGRGARETLELVQQAEPRRPARLCPGLHPDLEAICLKCLEKDPARRYPDAAALADDLDRWLTNRPTRARPLTRLRRLARAARRRPGLAAAALLAVLLLGGGPLAALYWGPEARIRHVENQLARGRPVTLVPAQAGPEWFRVITEPRKCQTSVDAEGAFSVHTWGRTLVELVRDPRRDHFRLSADVCHDKGDAEGEVGIYVARQAHAVAAGELHNWAALCYYDNRDDQKIFRPLLKEPPPGNAVRVAPFVFADRPERPFEWRFPAGPKLHFQPSPGVRCWRRLAVEVTPEGVRGWFDGREVGQLTADHYVAATARHRDLWQQDPAQEPFARGFEPVFTARGGLGLYVWQGSASFRNVAVEPLD